jgi:alpha-mannosidase
VTVTALKPSDDGRAWIVRLFGTGSKTKSVTLHWTTPGRHEVWLSDTTERALRPLTGPVPVTQASVVTLRVARPK